MWTVDVASDDALRHRLTTRFGREIEPWLDELPVVLSNLADRWQVAFDSLIQRGTMSVVVRCRALDGVRAVLKVSPDRSRLANEAVALPIRRVGESESRVDVAAAAKTVVDQAIALFRRADVLVTCTEIQYEIVRRTPIVLRVHVLFRQLVLQIGRPK